MFFKTVRYINSLISMNKYIKHQRFVDTIFGTHLGKMWLYQQTIVYKGFFLSLHAFELYQNMTISLKYFFCYLCCANQCIPWVLCAQEAGT